ncbi:MAG: hypothetical protein GWN58_23470 [Anaerolineae bacterium]|nr:hypothetical protein [Anaerolineae bacterium]
MADVTPLPLPENSGRVMCDFWCHECSGYTYFKLNTALDGNHVVICANPDCKHKHYRYVKDGKITDDRFYEGKDIAEEIEPMPSAYSKEARPMGLIARWRQREAIGEAR